MSSVRSHRVQLGVQPAKPAGTPTIFFGGRGVLKIPDREMKRYYGTKVAQLEWPSLHHLPCIYLPAPVALSLQWIWTRPV